MAATRAELCKKNTKQKNAGEEIRTPEINIYSRDTFFCFTVKLSIRTLHINHLKEFTSLKGWVTTARRRKIINLRRIYPKYAPKL